MNKGWANLSPKDGFLVTQQAYLSNFDQQVLTYLYQPIIGAKAFSLFLTLWTEMNPMGIRSERKSHLELFDILNCDLPEFYASRQKLEGIGLLKSFEGEDSLGHFFVYQLDKPVFPDSFFKDALLSSLLLEAVGERRFSELADHFKLIQTNNKDLKNVSTDFLTAFHISEQTLKEPNSLIRETQAEFKKASQTNQATEISLKNTNFDFKLLKELVSKGFTQWSSVDEAQKLILSEHLLYGIDEVEMARQIGQATDLISNKLNTKKLQLQISKDFTAHSTETQKYVAGAEQPEIVSKEDKSELSKEDQELIKAAKAYAPATYLENLKLSIHGGYVTYSERQLLKDLIDRNLFPVSVINILISYIVVDREITTLPNKLVDTMANNWSRAHVTTPEAAVLQIKNFAKSKATTRKQANARRIVTKETLPDWAKNDKSTQTTTINKNDQERLNQRLNALRKQHKEDK
ncbi:DnaD domain protein [Pediococcus ethanolidurans]|uniref:replication initiation and membrane attachment family protein n=1 Tax=Pediococcus ethanolidurans TaxID=319653 RepID=UPI0021E7CB49|nr:DnaD domain protein [Pediococcus ethanolidurans]MCV3322870.1 DnaD domain protein [Pediococcus ethanolidurans]